MNKSHQFKNVSHVIFDLDGVLLGKHCKLFKNNNIQRFAF